MSYSDFLRTRQINAPKIIDVRQRYGDASNHIWNKKLANSWVNGSAEHVITNQSDPYLSTPSTKKTPVSYVGSGSGGKVPDASTYTMSLGARSIASDVFSSTKLVVGGGSGNKCLASPAPSLIINQSGNTDQIKTGLNMASVTTCAKPYTPLTKSYFVDTLPDIRNGRIGILPSSRWNGAVGTNYGSQLPITASSTMTKGNWGDKSTSVPNLHSQRPPKTDFVTEPTGPQVSTNGAFGRAPKIGDALRRPKYVENHHGSIQVNLPNPYPYKPDQGGNYVPSRTA